MTARILAIALLVVFGSDLAIPLLAPDLRPALPACCRRDGKHHCAMMDMVTGDDGTPRVFPARCPMFPKQVITASINGVAPWLPAESPFVPVVILGAAKAQTEALYRISHSRTRDKRGPPFLS